MDTKGQSGENKSLRTGDNNARSYDFVLDKVIFSNVFGKDIRRIYLYRKSERLAKAIQLITPAFSQTPSLRNRLDAIAVGLIDAAILPPLLAREALSRELLALSSLLSIARTGGMLSDMNVDLLARETHLLLQEVASYEPPRLFLEDTLTLAELSKRAPDLREGVSRETSSSEELSGRRVSINERQQPPFKGQNKGQTKTQNVLYTSQKNNDRKDAIVAILQSKGSSYIKDISTVIRDVSEKTIQRELQALVTEGKVTRTGDRRWTQYSLAG